MSQIDAEFSECQAAIEELLKESSKLQQDFNEVVNGINSNFRQIDTCFNKHTTQSKKLNELQQTLNEIRQTKDEKKFTALNEKFTECKNRLQLMNGIKRQTQSNFLYFVIGHVSLKLWNEGDKLRFKQEYNNFKDRLVFIFFIFPFIQMYFGFSMAIHQIQSFCNFYYFSSLAIRENILLINGSKIEPWWIYHHYISIIAAIFFLLISPSHPCVRHKGVDLLNYFVCWQGIVIILQNRYQKQRDYTRKALNKKSQMDIQTSEVIDETPHSQYYYLIPALFFTYCYQLVISIYFLYLAITKKDEFETNLEIIQLYMLSICWFTLFGGNLGTLLKVLNRKGVIEFEEIFKMIAHIFTRKPKSKQKEN